MAAEPVGKLYDFGVRRAPFLIEGFPALMAVDAFGTIRKVRRLRPGDDVEEIGERMWAWLLEHHPEKRELRLVREPPAPMTPESTAGLVRYRGRWVDPRLLSDPHSPLAKRLYVDRLAKSAARKGSAFRLQRED